LYNSNRWIPIKTLNKGVTMLTIKKKFPITKPYMYGLSAFVVGYGAVMYGLITLPQRVDYDSLATLGINVGAVKDVKVEKAAETHSSTAADQSTNAGIDVADKPSTSASAVTTSTASPTTQVPTENPTTPVETTPETPAIDPTIPVVIPPILDPLDPITDPILDAVDNTVESILPL